MDPSFWQLVLDYQLREEGAPHNCLDDARAVMKLVLAVVDPGVSMEIPYIPDDVRMSFSSLGAAIIVLILVIVVDVNFCHFLCF